ncbi:FAD-dependent oxidoreductase [Pseudomonas sp. JR33AA]|uniref:FAD-dependent oxidoreductase n=1 Tax=Pseudomonas sp. JR33AA TaxID=2899113 RepID=UPI001F2BAC2A|nr:FAD-dependent oxidoreductase [Pseudomonas sp. JR33AA]MCE5977615.1 FAD-dependent oxidoreductase [Pseudomonas sp. JR33AA]
MEPIIIVGTGLAGYSVASEYRKLDPSRAIVIISKDDGSQYAKPMLSAAIAQRQTAQQLIKATASEMAIKLNAQLITDDEVIAIDPLIKQIRTTNRTLTYGELVLAVGADPVACPVTGTAAEEVMSVNDITDYSRLRSKLNNATSVLIVGAGLIGCEFANDLLHGGITPTVVDPNEYPLASLAPKAIGKALEESLKAAGVRWKLKNKVQHIEKAGLRYSVTLLDHVVIEVDAVISAVGLRPRLTLAKRSGIATRQGILVDGYGQTCIPGIFALGDCAQYADGRLLPFVRPTLIAARAIAATLAGTLTRIDFPNMPIIVKTPAHPVAVLPPRSAVSGSWLHHRENELEQWLFKDADCRLHGFAVSGSAAKTHPVLTRMIGNKHPDGPISSLYSDK